MLQRANERPAQVVVGSNALDSVSDTTLTLTGTIAAVQPTTLLEVGQELLLVTARSADATPVFTVVRGYAGTPKATAATGATVLIKPTWPRYEVRRRVLRAFSGPMTTYLPSITSTKVDVVANTYYVEMPSNCIDVLRVGFTTLDGSSTSQWTEITQWEFVEDVPTTIVASGKMLTYPYGFQSGQDLHVTYQRPYTWSAGGDDPAEAATIDVPVGAEDLPALYAAAYMASNREIARNELDKVEEWNQEAAMRQGMNLRLVSMLWGEFYRRLDECRRVQGVPKKRSYRKLQVITNGRWSNGGRKWRRGV